MRLRHKLTHAQAVKMAWVFFGLLVALEACAAFHFVLEQHDVFAASVIVTAWGKEAIWGLVEHFFAA